MRVGILGFDGSLGGVEVVPPLVAAVPFTVSAPPEGAAELDIAALTAACKARMPAYMVPHGVEAQRGPLPRNPNGKIDRKRLSSEFAAP